MASKEEGGVKVTRRQNYANDNRMSGAVERWFDQQRQTLSIDKPLWTKAQIAKEYDVNDLALTLDIISYISQSVGGQTFILWNRERAQRSKASVVRRELRKVCKFGGKKWGWNMAGRNGVGIWREERSTWRITNFVLFRTIKILTKFQPNFVEMERNLRKKMD